jgi:hypothetical protein
MIASIRVRFGPRAIGLGEQGIRFCRRLRAGRTTCALRPNFAFERELWGRGVTAIAGVDEVGVGAFAGPVVAAAVILAPGITIDGWPIPNC